LQIKKTDISSIFPIIIKIIKAILEDINNSAKLRFCKLYISELTVLVKARMAILNDFSKPMSSNTKKVDKINKLIKKEINIKNENLIFSSVILLLELKIVFLITLLGLINLIISPEVIFNNI
tara:strand:+ start:45 stop:410 length:366 start_codon:yes stop_codon:yes gene_type:complete